ncbi:MAG: Mrp/NBP35 family ATP-binding protein [Acidimicrobiales bacterium]
MSRTPSPRDAVAAVVEPQIGRTLGELGFVGEVSDDAVELILPVTNWPPRSVIEERVAAAAPGARLSVRSMTEEERLGLRNFLRAQMTAADDGHGHDATPAFLARTSRTRVLGISSGKGGVGKSTVTVNLAVALAARGHSVGLLDADVYGFSVPKMMGAATDPVVLGDLVLPTLAHGVRVVSMGYFVPDEQPVIWRGPMLHKAIEQLVRDAWWDQPDFLLIDMPPGTGDVALTLSEVVPRVEMYVVTTPQPAAQRVAQRSAYAARKLKLSVRGVIENMSWFSGDDGVRYEIFGKGGGDALARDLGVALLARVPLDPRLREGGDVGSPIVAADPTSDAAVAFANLADAVAAQGPTRLYRQELTLR